MKGLNKAYLIGHLGSDPVLGHTATGKPICRASLVTPHQRKVGDQMIDTPDFHRITLHGADAEFLCRNGHKGDALSVECAIRPSVWPDQNGHTHHEVSLVVETILWLSAKKEA